MTDARRFRGWGRRLAMGVALAALPAAAAVWTRSVSLLPIPRGSKQEIKNATYFTRDWSVSVTSVTVRDDVAGGGQVSPVWIFSYRNTDREPHFVSILVECQDPRRQPTTRYKAIGRLEANRKDDGTLEIILKAPSDDWKRSAFSKITIDFLSGPEG